MSTPQVDFHNIEFYLLGDEDNKKDSVVNVTEPDLLRDGLPQPHGICDAHMGTVNVHWHCSTCENREELCPGHPGRHILNYPLQSPLFLKYIVKWLKIICFKCGSLVIPYKKLNISKTKILSEYVRLSKGKSCAVCGEPHPNITKDKSDYVSVFKEVPGVEKKLEHIFPHEMAEIFSRIKDETVLRMGMELICHPRKLIIKVMRVPPNTIRPNNKKIEGGRSNNDDLTALIYHIVKANKKISPEIPKTPDNDFIKGVHNLGLLYFEMIRGGDRNNTNKRSIIAGTKQQLVSLARRQPRKEGRIRRNLNGRRVKGMGRSTITCDITLKIDEVGVPLSMASKLQRPEVVREYNKDSLTVYYMNGRQTYPGASKVLRMRTGRKHDVERINKKFPLEIGDVLFRDLITGDRVNFGRQPSLEPTSILSHRVVVLPHAETLRLNVLACSFYNADFDGDAMSIHIAGTNQSMYETGSLASPERFFISYKSGSPKIGEAQDSLIGTAELTMNKTRINKLNAMQLFAQTEIHPTFDKEMYSGRDIVSMLFKEKNTLINYNGKSKYYEQSYAPYLNYDPQDIYVKINRGTVESGILDKKTIGEGATGGIFHILHNKYGPTVALDISYALQQLSIMFMFGRGFTVGLDDLIISEESLNQIHNIESAIINESKVITDQLHDGKIVAPLGKTRKEYYEELQISKLSMGDMMVGPVISAINLPDNGFAKLIMTGSKGTPSNLWSSVSAIGQITTSKGRISEEYDGRTVPYYTRFDEDPRSRGYIANSYIQGLSSTEFIFDSMDARTSLIGIALGTAVSGESNRKSIKNLESLIINYIRSAAKSGNLVQLLYGDDGIDPRYLEYVVIETVDPELSYASFTKQYHATVKNLAKEFNNKKVQTLLDAEFEQLARDREYYQQVFMHLEQNSGNLYNNGISSSVNVKQIMNDLLYSAQSQKTQPLNPIAAIEQVRKLCDTLPYRLINDIQEKQGTPIPKYLRTSLTLLNILIRSYLNIANMIRLGIGNKLLKIIIERIKLQYSKSLIDYGTAIGIIAAQSVSEPMTQMALDSKHRISSGQVRIKGMTQIKAILSATKTEFLKTPTMTIQVLPAFQKNKTKVQEIANQIEMMPFWRFINAIQLFFEEFGEPVHSRFKDEKVKINKFLRYNKNITIPSNLTKWVLRFELNKVEMILKQITIDDIIFKIKKKYPSAFVVHNPETDDDIVLRVYFRDTLQVKGGVINKQNMIIIINTLQNMIIRGVDNIVAAYVIEQPRSVIIQDGQDKGKVIREKIFAIATMGTNISQVLENPFIDPDTIQSNSIIEIFENFGIEAAREKIIDELRGQVDVAQYRHHEIYADEMTFIGSVTSIERHGLSKREKNNFMLRISDSSPISVIEEAAVSNMKSNLTGISAPIMVGQSPQVGSLYSTFVLDEEFVKDNIKNIDSVLNELI